MAKFIASQDPYADLAGSTKTTTPGGGTAYNLSGTLYTKTNGGFTEYAPAAPNTTYGNVEVIPNQPAQVPVASSTAYRDTTKQNVNYLGSQTPVVPTTPSATPLALNVSTPNQAMQNILKQTNELLANPEIQKILTPEQVAKINSIQGLELKNQNILSQAKNAADAGQYGTFNSLIETYKKSQSERDKALEELTTTLNPLREKYLSSLLPGAEEQSIQNDLVAIRNKQRQYDTSLERGAQAQYGTGIALNLASGGEAQLRKLAQFDQQDLRNEESLLLDRLGLAQESRKLTQQGLEKGMEFLLQDYEIATKAFDAQDAQEQKIFDNAMKLDTQQRQQFADMLDLMQGTDPSKFSPEDEATIANFAKARGISYDLVKQALQVQYDKQMLDAAAKKADINRTNQLASGGTGGSELLSVNEAQSLGVPYGTTKAQAATMGKTPEKPATQAQETVSTYAARIEQSNPILGQLTDSIVRMNPVVFETQTRLPSYLQSNDIQAYMQAARNFINATLRRESGAVIADSEFQNAYNQYLPRPSDSLTTLNQKLQNRRVVEQTFKKAAGPAYQTVGELLGNTNDPLGIR